MKSIFKKISFPLFIAAIAFSAVAAFSFVSANTSTYEVTGYAWSDMPNASDEIKTPANHYGGRGLGWIQMKGTNYGVTLDSTGKFGGYGWSEFGGYVQFNPTGQAEEGAQVDPTCLADASRDCPVTGWIRFVSAPADPQAGDWDGWVKLSDPSWNNGATLLKEVAGVRKLSGYGWGDMVVGWVDFKYAQVKVVTDIEGCTDPAAPNYDPLATVDDGSCIPTTCNDTNPRWNPVKLMCDDCNPNTVGWNGTTGECSVCPNGTPVPPSGQCPIESCPTPANYPGMTGYSNLCACVPRAGKPADCPTTGCKIVGDPLYNGSATTANDNMCFCPARDFNPATGACGSCPNPNYTAGDGHDASSPYDKTCRCIAPAGHSEYCPTNPKGPKLPVYIET